MSEAIKKIIELINKTGDNCIVLDDAGNPAYVIMPFTRYQEMVGGQKNFLVKQEKPLNKANNSPESKQEEDDYFFEPVD